jgi:hypothetical protein
MKSGSCEAGGDAGASPSGLVRVSIVAIRDLFPLTEDDMGTTDRAPHSHRHAFGGFNALEREGLAVVSRRNVLKAEWREWPD